MVSIENVGSTLSTSPDKKSIDNTNDPCFKILPSPLEEEKKEAALQYMSPSLRKKISQKRLL
jgi:hypothetical protein